MANTTQAKTLRTAQQILDAAHQRQVEIETALPAYNSDMEDYNSDDEVDSEAPLLEAIYLTEGNTGLVTTTNFTATELDELWGHVSTPALSRWNVGRGRKVSHKAKDVMMMALSVLKRGEPWDVLALSFGSSSSVFEKMISNYVDAITDYIYNTFVSQVAKTMSMQRLSADNRIFRHFPVARYATDVRFQETNRPSGNHSESKPFFSGKHGLYGIKTEVSVLPIGLAVDMSVPCKGSVSDKIIMQERVSVHVKLTKKMTDEMVINDNEVLKEQYPNSWCILADKGYQGMAELVRCITPQKKPKGRALSLAEQGRNRDIAADRIIVENYFGRLCSLWGLMHKRFCWNFDKYYDWHRLAVALTNFHIMKHPLRDEDGEFWKRVHFNMAEISESKAKKRKLTQRKYQMNRKQRLSSRMFVAGADDIQDNNEDSDVDGV